MRLFSAKELSIRPLRRAKGAGGSAGEERSLHVMSLSCVLIAGTPDNTCPPAPDKKPGLSPGVARETGGKIWAEDGNRSAAADKAPTI